METRACFHSIGAFDNYRQQSGRCVKLMMGFFRCGMLAKSCGAETAKVSVMTSVY